MERSKKIVLVSHCILNQNTVVNPLARANGSYVDIVTELMKNGIGIHQLPCPEYRYLGLKREPMTKEQFDTEAFRSLNKSISKDTVNVVKEYINNGYDVIGIIGINESPTCSINGEKGILMEELLHELEKEEIKLKLIDVPTDYHDGTQAKDFIKALNSFIE